MDIEDLYVKRPRHCVPYAVVSFRFEKSFMAPSTEGQPHEAQQKVIDTMIVINNFEDLNRTDTSTYEKRLSTWVQ